MRVQPSRAASAGSRGAAGRDDLGIFEAAIAAWGKGGEEPRRGKATPPSAGTFGPPSGTRLVGDELRSSPASCGDMELLAHLIDDEPEAPAERAGGLNRYMRTVLSAADVEI